MVDARRKRDENALGTLSLLKSEVVRASKEPGVSGRLVEELGAWCAVRQTPVAGLVGRAHRGDPSSLEVGAEG